MKTMRIIGAAIWAAIGMFLLYGVMFVYLTLGAKFAGL